MGMFEARLMVQTEGKQKTIFSPQDELNCDPYNQQCNGGFTYSVSKFGQDYGLGTVSYNVELDVPRESFMVTFIFLTTGTM